MSVYLSSDNLGWVDPSGFSYPTSSSVESFNGHYWTLHIDLPLYDLISYSFYAIQVLLMDIIASMLEMLCSLLEDTSLIYDTKISGD